MSKNKKLGLGIAAVAAGAGLAYATNKSNKQKIKKIAKAEPPIDYIKSNETAKQLPDKCIKALDKWADNINEENK